MLEFIIMDCEQSFVEQKIVPLYTYGENDPKKFFNTMLPVSAQYDLCLGFFNSSGFHSLSSGMARFIKNEGRMRFIINQFVSPEDYNLITRDNSILNNEDFKNKIFSDLYELQKVLETPGEKFFNCLTILIEEGKLDIKIALINNQSHGIVHQKFGILKDFDNNRIVFNGSTNFSKTAFEKNFELLSIYKSWSQDTEIVETVSKFESLFDTLWNNEFRGVFVSDGKSLIKELKIIRYSNKNINESSTLDYYLEEELAFSEKDPSSLQAELESNEKYRLPSGVFLFNHQKQAIRKWLDSNKVGFFEMATGTGKTFTALAAISYLANTQNHLHGIILLVPRKNLASQWEKDVLAFGFQTPIICDSDHLGWENELNAAVMNSIWSDKIFFCIALLSTMVLNRFQSIMSNYRKHDPDLSDLAVICDEAHNLGENYLNNIPKARYRLGLSATPLRQFDQEGTNNIKKFFDYEKESVFRYSLSDAINDGYLCKYYYYPLVVELTDDEYVKYLYYTKKICKFFDSDGKLDFKNQILVNLLLARKRIIHKAQNKLDGFRKAIELILKIESPIHHLIVFAPSGKPENDNDEMENDIDNDDESVINEYARILFREYKIKQHQYISGTNESVLRLFSDGKIQALTVKNKLDEGVDIKQAQFAVFCSSSGNPRQFIQRRGRLLRTFPNKDYAYIFDLIVVPSKTKFDIAEKKEAR